MGTSKAKRRTGKTMVRKGKQTVRKQPTTIHDSESDNETEMPTVVATHMTAELAEDLAAQPELLDAAEAKQAEKIGASTSGAAPGKKKANQPQPKKTGSSTTRPKNSTERRGTRS